MPRQPPKDVAALRMMLWQHTQARCEWPRCPSPAREMAHVDGKGSGGRSAVYTLRDVLALCVFHHRCQDGEGGEAISGRSRRAEVMHLYETIDAGTFPGEMLLKLDMYVNERTATPVAGLKRAISYALAEYAFAGRVPATISE